MVKVRRYTPNDAPKIDEIYQRCHGHFNLPIIKHSLGMPIVEKDGEIIAFGAFQLIPEVIMVADNHRPKREQVEALTELLGIAEMLAKLHDFTEYYAFPDTSKFGDILKKHYGFEDCKPVLIKKVEG